MSQLGWKAAFGSPEGLARLGVGHPIAAALPDDGLVETGATVSIAGWTKPVIEIEVAIWIGRGLGAAIELADVEFPPDDVERVIATGVYHRNVVLGPPRVQTLDGATARALCDGAEIAFTDDLLALTGTHETVLAVCREAAGRELRDGEVVIAGSVFPPFPLEPGQRWHADLGPLGALSLAIA